MWSFLFMSESNAANYANDTNLHACEKKFYDVQRKLESQSWIPFDWFNDNYLKANSGKSHVMLATDNKLKINVQGSPISNEKIVKLLGVTEVISFLLSLILVWYVKKLVKNSIPLL